MRTLALVGALAVFGACMPRTVIPPKQPETQEQPGGVAMGCEVMDYSSATDVPNGATNLGWVTVPFAGDDEATYVALRRKICELGGNALSQAAWERQAMDSSDAQLRANAWTVP